MEDELFYNLNDTIQKENLGVDYRNANYKLIKVQIDDICILLKQDFRIGKGGIFWDGSYVLTRMLDEMILKNSKDSLNIIELGAGTGLPGIYSYLKGHKVILTDIKKNIPLLVDIKKINNIDNQRLIIEKLNWEEEKDIDYIKSKYNENFDIIICSELIYMEEYFTDLINVIKSFSSINTKIILSFKIRLPELTQKFLNQFDEFFKYIYVDEKLYDSFYSNKKMKIIIAERIN